MSDKIKNLQKKLNAQNLFGKPNENYLKKQPDYDQDNNIEHKTVKKSSPPFLAELKAKQAKLKNKNK